MAHEHSFATPGPAGLGALAVACFGFGAVFLGLVKPGGLPILAAWLFGGCLVQYTTAVIELKDHNVLGGNVFLFFAAFFMLGAALSTLSKFFLLAGAGAFIPKAAAAAAVAQAAPIAVAPITWFPKPDAYIEGWLWMAGAGFLTVVTPGYAKGNLFIFILVLLVDVALWLIVGIDSGWYGNPATTRPIVGWCLIIAGWLGVYLAGATVCNTVYGKPIFFVPKPLVK